MTIDYRPKGVCSRQMLIEVENGVVQSLQVKGGCAGNLKGLSMLVPGMTVTDVIAKLEGIPCGPRPTSCPDQLAQALKQAMA